MLVCAHGNVAEYCKEHHMDISDTWNGEIIKYDGVCRVLVTDSDISKNEYYYLKGELLAKGIELISTRHNDESAMTEYLIYATSRKKDKYRGRNVFNDGAVIQKILELRETGLTMREIRDAEGVRRQDGGKLSLSTIQKIINNKKKED